MDRVLFVTSSAFGTESKSRRFATELVDGMRRRRPSAVIVERHLDPATVPHLTGEVVAALMIPAAERTTAQSRAAAYADQLIEEVEAADTIVIASPMYNHTVSSTLKAWFDQIARAGRTFRYTEAGPVGLLRDKRVLVVTARGGIYTGAAAARDFQEPYLRFMFRFLGIDDVTFVHVEGLQIGPEVAERGVARARQAIARLLTGALAA
ncbi:MAG: FMN-dependent NADH-azoreductase [Stellaceae bacterium]